MSIEKIRRELADALVMHARGYIDASRLADHIEGLISAKVEEILQAREDNARAGSNRS